MIYVNSITVDPASLTLGKGNSQLLRTTVLPENADDQCVTWSSSNSDVASVNPLTGLVYAKDKGEAVITATAMDGSNVTGACALTVTETTLVTSLELNSAITQNVGWSGYISTTICPPNATQKCLEWCSSNPDVVTVNRNSGLVAAVQPGIATITATTTDGSELSSTCTVTVTELMVTEVTLNPSTMTVRSGWAGYICKSVCPTCATNRNILWSSSDETVAVVDAYTGLITTLKSGEVTIYATATDGSEVFGTCDLTVRNVNPVPVTKVELNPKEIRQNVQWQGNVFARITPANATKKALTWTSDHPEVAEVNPTSGVITAKSKGQAVITATATDGSGEYATCTLTVTDDPMAPVYNHNKQHFADLLVDAPGVPVTFTRIYDAMNTESGPFGPGWYFSLCGSCAASGSTEVVKVADKTLHFSIDGDQYVPLDTNNKFVKNADNTYTLYTLNGIMYRFNANGFMEQVADRNGNTLDITLDAATNLPTKVTDSVGRTYDVNYNADHLITSITQNDASQRQFRRFSFEYTNGLLSASKNPLGKIIHQYEYSDGLLRKVCDNWNQVIRTVQYQGRVVTAITEQNKTTSYFYGMDGEGHSILTKKLENGRPQTEIRNAMNQIVVDYSGTRYHYDTSHSAFGRLETVYELNGHRTEYQYDAEHPHNPVSICCYNDKSQLVKERLFTYGFDPQNADNLILQNEIENTYLLDSETGEVRCVDMVSTTTEYDGNGNILSVSKQVCDKTEVVSYTYNQNGTYSSYTDEKNTVKTYEYDAYGYPTKITTTSECGSAVTIRNIFNMFGRRLTHIDQNNLQTSFVYDVLDHVVKESVGNNKCNQKVTREVFDDYGRITLALLPNEYECCRDSITEIGHGVCISNSYDNSNNLGVAYSYGTQGKLKRKIEKEYTIEFTDSGKFSSISKSGVRLLTYNYTNDSRELLMTEVYADGRIIAYEYDACGRLIGIKNNGLLVHSYCYDGCGAMICEKDEIDGYITYYQINADGSTTVEKRDAAGKVINRSISMSNSNLSISENGEVYGTERFYQGNNLNIIDQYSVNSSVSMLKNTILDENYQANILCERILTPDYIELLTTFNQYTASNQINRQTVIRPDCSCETFQYNYDQNDNIVSICKNGVLCNSYTFDNQNQLLRNNDACRNQTDVYEYDSDGNITSVKNYSYSTGTLGTLLSMSNYKYAAAADPNRLTEFAGQTLTYDALGRIVNYRDNIKFNWTGAILTSIKKGNVTLELGTGANPIKKKTKADQTTNYVFLRDKNYRPAISEITNNNCKIYFTYDSYDRPVYIQVCGRLYSYVLNALGDVAELMDPSGNTVVRYTYDAWGACTIYDASGIDLGTVNPLRFRSCFYDDDLGLYCMSDGETRFYDPRTGRFATADAKSSYVYSGNNPVSKEATQVVYPSFSQNESTAPVKQTQTKKTSKSYNTGKHTKQNCFWYALSAISPMGAMNPNPTMGSDPNHDIPDAMRLGYSDWVAGKTVHYRLAKVTKDHKIRPHEVMVVYRTVVGNEANGFHYMRKAYGDPYWTHTIEPKDSAIMSIRGNPWDYDRWSDETWYYDAAKNTFTYAPVIGYYDSDMAYYTYMKQTDYYTDSSKGHIWPPPNWAEPGRGDFRAKLLDYWHYET